MLQVEEAPAQCSRLDICDCYKGPPQLHFAVNIEPPSLLAFEPPPTLSSRENNTTANFIPLKWENGSV